MIYQSKVIALIPARSGSKGLLNKNILECSGMPLIAWTIEAAKKSRYIDKVLVTTDSEKIVEVAKCHGAWAPFIRPESFASDSASSLDVIKHTINYLKINNYFYDLIVYLQPTSPLRTSAHIDAAIELYSNERKNNCDTLVSVYEVDKKYNWLMKQDDQGYIGFNENINLENPQRQSLKQLYMPNGAIYISRAKNFDGFYKGKVIPYVMPRELSIDIDTQEDFNQASMALSDS